MAAEKTAVLYRMVMEKHVCPWGLRAKHLLKSEGYTVDDRWLTTREQTDAFKAEHGVKTTPQVFIDGAAIWASRCATRTARPTRRSWSSSPSPP
jgi:glutaredoxin